MKIYFDVSCLNRPFDDQEQPRIRLEAEAVTLILDRIDLGQWRQTSSRMVDIEVAAISDETRRRRVAELFPEGIMELSESVFQRARQHMLTGLHVADAVHVAAAESLGADVFLTCDDRLLRQCQRSIENFDVVVDNPLTWLRKQDNV